MSPELSSKLEKAKHIGELALVLPIYLLLRLIPIRYGSFAIGKLLRLLGPLHSTHQTALKNLRLCFPNKTDAEIEKIARESWENLGRTGAELPHITMSPDSKIEEICPISGTENFDEAREFAAKNKTGMIIVSAHIGNWELGPRRLSTIDDRVSLIYRRANNPYVERLIRALRESYSATSIKKGDRSGIKDMVSHLKDQGTIGILLDQKASEGIPVNFFGTEVKASSSAADLAIKFNSPIVMGRIVRDSETKVNFVLKTETPIYPAGMTAEEINQKIYDTYEKWIREYPSQWFWQHNRFGLTKKST